MSIQRLKYGTILLVFTVLNAWALAPTDIRVAHDFAPLGKHYPVLILEKNENPQNLLVTFVRLDDSCHLMGSLGSSKDPVVDYYWLMDGTKFKPVHPLIKSGIRHRMQMQSLNSEHTLATLNFNDVRELDPKLRSANIEIQSQKTATGCRAVGRIKLGGEVVEVDKIHSEARSSFLPPFRKLVSVKVFGHTAQGPWERVFGG